MKKKELIQKLTELLKQKKAELNQGLAELKQEMANETKSSAGDKFETSREMMNQSKNGIEGQLAKVNRQIQELQQLPLSSSEKVSYGSLVITDSGDFLFGLGLGKVTLAEETIFALSINAPITRSFIDKKKDEEISFAGKKYLIKKIL